MLSNKILKKYKKNKQSYLIITNQYGGGTKEIYNEFIKHRKDELKQKAKISTFIPTTKIRSEILEPDKSSYNDNLKLNDSLQSYIDACNLKPDEEYKRELNGLLSGSSDKINKLHTLLKDYILSLEVISIPATVLEPDKIVKQPDPLEWNVQVIYDGSSKSEGKLFLGGYETGANFNNPLDRANILKNGIKKVITIMEFDYLYPDSDIKWDHLKSLYHENEIENIQIKNIIDYKVDNLDRAKLGLTLSDRVDKKRIFNDMITHMVPIINYTIESGQNMLIHCVEGKSRSVSLVAAWLGKKLHIPADIAYKYIKDIRSIIEPNKDYVQVVQNYINDDKTYVSETI